MPRGTDNGRYTHGAAVNRVFSREYRAWRAMKNRCYTKSHAMYHHYGGKGIEVCATWRDDFPAFLRDVGACPTGYTLGRVDNARGYAPSNCRWESRKSQARNTSRNRYVCVNGTLITIGEAAERFAISYRVLWRRLVTRGDCLEVALRTG